jgi:hypothetical protein
MKTKNTREMADNISTIEVKANQTDSAVSGGDKNECGPSEKIRRQNSAHRDRRSNLGKGKNAEPVVGD